MRRKLWTLPALVLGLVGSFVPSAVARPVSVDDVVAMVEETSTVSNTWQADETSRVIEAKKGELSYTVRLMNCTGTDDCNLVLIFATFDMVGSPALADYEKANHYNDSHANGRAFILANQSEGEGYVVGMDMVVNLDPMDVLTQDDFTRFWAAVDSYIEHYTN